MSVYNYLLLFMLLGIIVIYFAVSHNKKKGELKRNKIDSKIKEQNKATGFEVSHCYDGDVYGNHKCYISISTKEMISVDKETMHLGHFDGVDSVTVGKHSESKYFLILRFKDCKKINIYVK